MNKAMTFTNDLRLLAQRDARIAELEHEKEVLRDAIQGRHDMQAASVGGEREAFEAWLSSLKFVSGQGPEHVAYCLHRDLSDKYTEEWVSDMYRGWQARAALSPAGGGVVTDAARDVLAERSRQVTAEGWTPEHDDEHANGSLAAAASCYALRAGIPYSSDRSMQPAPHWWPWDAAWWKPSGARRMLVKAGALILAEIERLDRAEAKPQANSQEGSDEELQ